MARLPVLSARDVIKALGRAGFAVVSQRGSHAKLKSAQGGTVRIVIVPKHPEIAVGTLLSIIRQSGLTREEFHRLTK